MSYCLRTSQEMLFQQPLKRKVKSLQFSPFRIWLLFDNKRVDQGHTGSGDWSRRMNTQQWTRHTFSSFIRKYPNWCLLGTYATSTDFLTSWSLWRIVGWTSDETQSKDFHRADIDTSNPSVTTGNTLTRVSPFWPNLFTLRSVHPRHARTMVTETEHHPLTDPHVSQLRQIHLSHSQQRYLPVMYTFLPLSSG